MNIKGEIENREKKPIYELGIGHTFIYGGFLHLTVNVSVVV